MKWDALRVGQRNAIKVIIDRYKADQEFTAIVGPTRYGKSDVMRVAAVELWQDGFMPVALALSPDTVLAEQLGDANRWNQSLARYGIDNAGIKIRTLDTLEVRPNANGEMFISATMQMVQRNIDVFCKWVESVLHTTGRRPLIMVDEAHTGSEDNTWGGSVEQLVKAGARAVLLTATPTRSDGKRIPGFKFETISEEPVSLAITKPGSEPQKIRVEIYEGVKRLVRLIADQETPFSDAWAQQALCKVGRVPFDVDLSKFELGTVTKGVRLSELDKTADARKALSKAVRSPVVIREGVGRMVRELRRFKSGRDTVAAIVFCGNDGAQDDKTINKHANDIKKEIQQIAPELKVLIATSAEAGKANITAFSGGVGDVLIVKQMAGRGLDIPRLKVGLDLSPVRTPAAYVQRMMRIATPFDGIMHCVWIGLDDVLSRALFEALVTSGGGGATATDLELVRAYEKDREIDPETPAFFGVDGTSLADFEDSHRHRGTKAQVPVVEALLTAFPALTQIASHAEIAERSQLFGIIPVSPTADATMVHDTGITTQTLRSDINELANDITTARNVFGGYDPSEWESTRRDVFVRAYRAAGIPHGQRLRDITDIGMLQAVKRELESMLSDVPAVKR